MCNILCFHIADNNIADDCTFPHSGTNNGSYPVNALYKHYFTLLLFSYKCHWSDLNYKKNQYILLHLNQTGTGTFCLGLINRKVCSCLRNRTSKVTNVPVKNEQKKSVSYIYISLRIRHCTQVLYYCADAIRLFLVTLFTGWLLLTPVILQSK